MRIISLTGFRFLEARRLRVIPKRFSRAVRL